MNHLLILLDGTCQQMPNIHSLAASSRLGMIEGWKGLESLLQDEPAEEGVIKLTCGAAALDGDGNISAILTDKSDMQELAEAICNMEIDGVKFQAEAKGRDILLALDGEGLSARIMPNPCAPGAPLAQVCASAKQGKKTASALNKLIYRTAKKRGRALFVKRVGAAKPLPEGFELMELNADIDCKLFSKIKNSSGLVTIIIWDRRGSNPANTPVLIHGAGLVGSGAGKFSDAACSRGFRMQADGLLPWVMRAASAGAFK